MPRNQIYWQVGLIRTNEVVARRVLMARTALQQMVGLLGERMLPEGHGLILPRCQAVHTWGMRFSIDVLFVDRDWQIVALVPGLSPWRVSPMVWRADAVIELPAGTAAKLALRVGDRLHLVPTEAVPGHGQHGSAP